MRKAPFPGPFIAGGLVFGHPELGTPIDPSELTRSYLKPALKLAEIEKPLQPRHGLRDTALTFYATTDGVAPPMVQARAGHAQYAITERYVHDVWTTGL